MDGALALALPTHKGQSMEIEKLTGSGNIHWTAKNNEGAIWLNTSFILQDSHLIPVSMGTDLSIPEVSRLGALIENALHLNPKFINNQTDYEISTQLQFPNDWGLGSSSTLIANVAKWAEIDALALFGMSWPGSGYDIAVAMVGEAILYQLKEGKPKWELSPFHPPFHEDLFFVHLGKKQNSEKEVGAYRSIAKPSPKQLELVSSLTKKITTCSALIEFEALIAEHEALISEILKKETVKSLYFSDYPGGIKSLGAWGGDFILATGKGAEHYFKRKGYSHIFTWNEMIKHS